MDSFPIPLTLKEPCFKLGFERINVNEFQCVDLQNLREI